MKGELDTYGWKLQETIGKEIGEKEVKELAILLLIIANKTPTKEDVQAIEAAAGKFKGLASTITAKVGTGAHVAEFLPIQLLVQQD